MGCGVIECHFFLLDDEAIVGNLLELIVEQKFFDFLGNDLILDKLFLFW